MQVCTRIAGFRAEIARYRAAGESVGLVTTMGALHNGHLALVAAAKADHDRVVTTIFVNPTQFGEAKDLETYPRDDAGDLEKFERAGVDAVLMPSVEEIYPEGDETIVETVRLANVLHGKVRPGHFRGVATVVTKLFNIAQPDAAYFGEKDWQQLQVIKRMVRDLHMPVRVVGVPTVREADGLAMSSRNVRLGKEDRAAAAVLSRGLDRAGEVAARKGSISQMESAVRGAVNGEPRAKLRAIDIVDVATLEPATGAFDRPVAILLSADLGGVLLIDQREFSP
ncbi:pantoate--beta-alanine ligase [Aestuariibius sp. 2305UL40-4]|uniref:pantoate--beta-alanine ligase n=1 Tax=Aestuariibius violaceus TaxID=3234132 RepID=UPI00345E1A7B